MNPETIERLLHERQVTQEAAMQAENERIEKYRLALALEEGMIAKITTLFDAVGVERDGVGQYSEFTIIEGEGSSEAKTSVWITYDTESQPGPTTRGLFGFIRQGEPIVSPTNRINFITVTTTLQKDVIEHHAIRPYKKEGDGVEQSLKHHFRIIGDGSRTVPQIDHTDPDAVLAHVQNVNETIDTIISLHTPTQPTEIHPS
ncbi:MAG: hypothetical protein NTX11_00015 [Candidatus Saccharibacteria bacterium]|nr:hypothetical protein [Candidatus Saccharibacteria bacterium]